jgi:peptide-methionine (S)-S-oxide reductase
MSLDKGRNGSMAELDTAVLGGGCFWCLEAVFRRLEGVEEVTPGYAGGHLEDPSYRQVCSGTTGHAEVVRIRFDPARVGYLTLLDLFYRIHDPTTPNRQGADVGPQYRSIILWSDEDQRDESRRMIEVLEREERFSAPIVTELAPLEAFYPAEAEHHEYYDRNSGQGYCRIVIEPKLQKAREFIDSRRAAVLGTDAPEAAP